MGGLGYLSSFVHNTSVIILRRKIPSQKGSKGHKRAQVQTIVHELQRVALSPPVESPHLDFPPQSSHTETIAAIFKIQNVIQETRRGPEIHGS